jgi:hypothetical protein
MGCLLGPVVTAWPHCAAQVRVLAASGQLREHAQAFTDSRGGYTARPAEMLAGLLGPAQTTSTQQRQRPKGTAPA